jgi:hypothetical protein
LEGLVFYKFFEQECVDKLAEIFKKFGDFEI